MHPSVHSSTIYNSEDMEITQMSIDRWMDKENVVWKYNGILLGHKKEWNNTICNNMDGHWDYHTRWNKPDREGHMSLICGIKKKMIQMNLFTK